MRVKLLVIAALVFSSSPSFSEVDVCPVRCPVFAPNYSPMTLFCQETPIEPLAAENLFTLPTAAGKLFKYVFFKFKPQIESGWKNRKPHKPACNESASRFPEYKADPGRQSECVTIYQRWNKWLNGDEYPFDRAGIQFTVWCIGIYGPGNFDSNQLQKKISESGTLDRP